MCGKPSITFQDILNNLEKTFQTWLIMHGLEVSLPGSSAGVGRFFNGRLRTSKDGKKLELSFSKCIEYNLLSI